MDTWAKSAVDRFIRGLPVTQVEISNEHVFAIKKHMGPLKSQRRTGQLVKALEKNAPPTGFQYSEDKSIFNAVRDLGDSEFDFWCMPTTPLPSVVSPVKRRRVSTTRPAPDDQKLTQKVRRLNSSLSKQGETLQRKSDSIAMLRGELASALSLSRDRLVKIARSKVRIMELENESDGVDKTYDYVHFNIFFSEDDAKIDLLID